MLLISHTPKLLPGVGRSALRDGGRTEMAKKQHTLRIPLRILFYREGERWIAHCLECDLMGDGETKSQAAEQLCEALAMQLEFSLAHNNPRNLFRAADGKFFGMFAAGRDVGAADITIS